MAFISIVQKAHLETTWRIDAEFYQPEYISSFERLLKTKPIPLSHIAEVSDGNHLTIAEQFQNYPGVRYLRGQDVSTDMMIEDRNEVYIPEEVYEKIERAQIKKRDVLITIVGANTGLIGLAYDIPEKLSASCKLGIARAHAINPGYLYSFLISRYGQNQIKRNKRGGGQTGLILPDMRNLLIARFPDIEDKISRITLEGHEKVKRAKILYTQAEQLLMSELGLQDWKPPHELAYVRSYSHVAQTRRLDAEFFQPKYQDLLNKLSTGVRLERLGKLVTYTKGVEVGGSAYTDLGIPFWRVSNLTKHGIDDASVNFISGDLYNSLRSSYEPQQGELLLSKDATPGIAYYLEQPIQGIISSGILRLSIIDDIPPQYLEQVLNSIFVQLQVEQDAGGSVIKHWKPTEVLGTLIPRLLSTKENEIAGFVGQSHAARREASVILEKAKRAVEIAIEEGEDKAMAFLQEN